MNIFKRSQITVLLFVFVVCGVFLTGCMHLQKSFPDIKTYGLDTGSGGHAAYTGSVISVRLNPISAVPQFADRYLAYRTDETRYESDFYNQLVASPAVMIEDQAHVWLKGSPAIEFVLPTDVMTNPYYSIDGKVLEFYGDYRKINEPKAVLKMEWTVSKSAPEGIKVCFQKVYPEATIIAGTSPGPLVEGWNQDLVKILSAFEADLIDLAGKSKKK
jgi:roadblock/LC7 domain-containing protein